MINLYLLSSCLHLCIPLIHIENDKSICDAIVRTTVFITEYCCTVQRNEVNDCLGLSTLSWVDAAVWSVPSSSDNCRSKKIRVGWSEFILFSKSWRYVTFIIYATLINTVNIYICFYFIFYFCLRGRFPSLLYSEIFYRIHNDPAAHHGIIVGDAGLESGTSAPEVWCAGNEPPHLHITISCLGVFFIINRKHFKGLSFNLNQF